VASITYWNRLEPRPLARNLNDTLAARLRDPLWLLARQWQFGEFQGEDAGSPAFASIKGGFEPLTAWHGNDPQWQKLGLERPLEAELLAEPFDPGDISLQVELALSFERELRAQPGMTAARVEAVLGELRLRLPLGMAAATDEDAQRLLLVCGARSFDGVGLFGMSRSEPPTLPPGANIDPADLDAVRDGQRAFAAQVAATYGSFGNADPPAWRPERLEHEGALSSQADTRTDFQLIPELSGSLDWYAADRIEEAGTAPAGTATSFARSVIPVHVGFRGMPNARWWDFESGQTDFGDLRVDRRDVAKLVVMDFMLIHGNDWFVIPVEQDIGSAMRIDRLAVTDVFGMTVVVPRAEDTDRLWTLFTSSTAHDSASTVPKLLRLPSAGSAMQSGPPIEDVRFFRDETANLVWAVEHAVPSASGEPWPGQERSNAERPAAPPGPAGLHYQIQTEVPLNWIPFVAVTLDPASGEIALERAAMLDGRVDPPVPIAPFGKLLRPAVNPYQVREEEISRAGLRVVRMACRSRWIDGSTHLWMSRVRRAAMGEGSSGLLFDVAKEN
jgi:hypothetical protein